MIFRRIYHFFNFFGINLKKLVFTLIRLPRYSFTYFQFVNSKKNSDFKISKLFPCIDDVFEKSGIARGHYFYQDLFVAKMIHHNAPKIHFDIGSRIDGFVAHVASFRKINIFDIRSLDNFDENVTFHQLDLMSEIPSEYFEITDSISCLHTLEHFGLGRYGDKIDPFGYLKGFKNITSLIKQNGLFYFSVPIGPQRIEFNAHRVFSLNYLLAMFKHDFDVINFSFVDDEGDFYENVILSEERIENNCDCIYGCGIFILKKR